MATHRQKEGHIHKAVNRASRRKHFTQHLLEISAGKVERNILRDFTQLYKKIF